MSDYFASVAFLPEGQASDMVDVAMRSNNMPDPGRLKSQGPDIIFDSARGVADAGIDHHQLAISIYQIDVSIFRRREAGPPTA